MLRWLFPVTFLTWLCHPFKLFLVQSPSSINTYSTWCAETVHSGCAFELVNEHLNSSDWWLFSTLRLNTNISHWDEWKYTNVMKITMEYDSLEEFLILVWYYYCIPMLCSSCFPPDSFWEMIVVFVTHWVKTRHIPHFMYKTGNWYSDSWKRQWWWKWGLTLCL